MYNVLEKFRALEAARTGETLEGPEKQIWQDGQIGRLKELHDEIDAAVAAAYGWPADLSEEDILSRLVALNRERALEEAAGRVRWLRPEYQNPAGGEVAATTKDADLSGEAAQSAALPDWPKSLPERIAAVRAALEEMGEASARQIAARYRGTGEKGVTPLLESLAALGQAEILEDGRYAA
ncbi:MAG: RNA-binding protein [Alphaproteobacteria bacterium HGW-Alphaproteobacteria-18]|nr:MAG: RNA-binding protein [Alphaproteobacteria bacterium HGW-Alphaproteobacteria-18]